MSGKVLRLSGCVAFAVALLAVLSAVFVPAFAAATFSIDVSPAKTAYYIGETVQLNVKLQWQDVTPNVTLGFQLWNSSSQIATLGTYQVTSANGSQTLQFTTSAITAKRGTATYVVKAVEQASGICVAQDSFSITVQDISLTINIAWSDASMDRQIDVSETVTYTIYVNWAFANETKTYTLKVEDQGIEKLVDTVQVSVGSGSAQKTYVTAYDSAGAKTLRAWLEDMDGKVVASKTIMVNVGSTTGTAAKSQSWLDQLNAAANKYLVVILVAVVIALILIGIKMYR
ncbi:MAG: hypothetical protein QXR17_07770 [Candidatus Bathyarchaeia archaeon]